MKTYGERVSEKTDIWIDGPGSPYCEGVADGQYLRNRLLIAFRAGADAGKEIALAMLAERDREAVR
jgi:hypothetical protein